MKKLLYILSLVWVAVSCADELVETKPVVDSDKVTIDFSVSIPEAPVQTKAFADNPALTNLYLAVFDENGFLVEYVEADPDNTEYATSNGTSYNYSVALTLSDTKRIIHFLANAPASLNYGTEEEVITSLYTEGINDAYWYRKEVSSIQATLTNSGLVATTATVEALSEIPLIRNFVKIEVSTSEGCAFSLQSYAVINAPNKGSVAPYSRTTGTFVDYPGKTVTQLRTAGYDAFVPGDATLNSGISNLNLDQIKEPSPVYIYERETPINNPVYILVYGQYDEKNVYYRVDLRDDEHKYFPLLRNFQYTVNINTVSHTGYATPEEAAKSVGSGDISTSIDTEHLTNISDGSVRLSVDYTSMVRVTEDNVNLEYNFENLGSVTLQSVKVTCEGDALSGIVVNGSTVKEANFTNPQSNQWETLVVDPATIGAEQKKGTVTIVATYKSGTVEKTIQRRVTYTLRRPYEMQIECVPGDVPFGVNQEVDLNVTIPDDLGTSMFPLDFAIEAEKLSLAPNNDELPVATGKSTIPGITKGSFWYVKSLSKEEYDALAVVDGKRTFQCHFKANTNKSATDIYVTNPYFVAYVDDILPSVTGLQPYDVDRFTNYTQKYFRNLDFTDEQISIGVDKSTRFTFTMSEVPTGLVTVTLSNAKPADTETDLVNPRADADGNAVFDFDPSTTSGSFDLLTTTEDKAVVVKLEATHFQTESLAAARDWAHFSGGTFAGSLNETAGDKTVTYKFGIPSSGYTSGMVVTVKFDGLAFPDNTVPDRWIAKGNGVYEYRPTSAGNTTITLTSTENGKRTNYVTVSAPGFEAMTSEIKQSNATYALKMYNPTTQSNDWRAQAWYHFEQPLQASQTYKLTCWIKVGAELNNVNCSIFLQDSRYTDGTNQQMYNNAITGIGREWKRVEYTFTTPNRQLDKIVFNIGHIAGSIYLDDVSVIRDGTGIELIQNGDFESGTAERWDTNGGASVTVVPEGHVGQ